MGYKWPFNLSNPRLKIFKCKQSWKQSLSVFEVNHTSYCQSVCVLKKINTNTQEAISQKDTFILAAFPLGSKKCRTHRSTVLLWPTTLYRNIPLQSAKDGAFPPVLLAGKYQGPQKHFTQQGQVGPLISPFYVPFINVLIFPNVQDFRVDLSAF